MSWGWFRAEEDYDRITFGHGGSIDNRTPEEKERRRKEREESRREWNEYITRNMPILENACEKAGVPVKEILSLANWERTCNMGYPSELRREDLTRKYEVEMSVVENLLAMAIKLQRKEEL